MTTREQQRETRINPNPSTPIAVKAKASAKASASQRRAASAEQRGRIAWEMRLAGHTWEQIGARLSIHTASAYNAAMRYGARHSEASQERREHWQPIALDQLAQMWDVIEPTLATTDERARAAAIERALRAIELYARILGVKPSETPPAARLARYQLEVRP